MIINDLSELDRDTLEAVYEAGGYWGLSIGIDIFDCDPKLIRDPKKIEEFVILLCDRIDMKRYGECKTVRFGEDPRVCGFSMVQFIETSLVSAHFVEETEGICLDVFSCKFFDPQYVAQFALEFFKGSSCDIASIALRRSKRTK